MACLSKNLFRCNGDSCLADKQTNECNSYLNGDNILDNLKLVLVEEVSFLTLVRVTPVNYGKPKPWTWLFDDAHFYLKQSLTLIDGHGFVHASTCQQWQWKHVRWHGKDPFYHSCLL